MTLQAKSEMVRTRIGMPFGSSPWIPFAHNKNITGTEREKDVQDVCYFKMRKEMEAANLTVSTQDMWCDYSQSVHRLPCRRAGPSAILSSTMLYSYGHDVTFSKSSHMRLLGWPKDMMGGEFKESEFNNMAADAWSLPACAAVCAASSCNPHAPWWSEKSPCW